MKLYYSTNLNPRVAVAVARHLQSPVEYVLASPRHPDHEEAFRVINPNTLVPVLVEDGCTVWETDAVACRLSQIARSDFWPTDERLPELMSRPANEAALADAAAALRRFAPILDEILAGRAWLVHGRLSYADFRVASVLPFAESAQLPVGGYSNIARWHDRLNELDAWRAPFAGFDEAPQAAAGGSR